MKGETRRGADLERVLRLVHGWMGVLVLPWVVLAGLSGLYMNHPDGFARLLPFGPVDWQGIEAQPDISAADQHEAMAIAAAAMPGVVLQHGSQTLYQDRAVFGFTAPDSTQIIVDQATSHFWKVSRYRQDLFDPDNHLQHISLRWDRIIDSLHSRGWLGNRLGTWPADLAATALMLFGLSGIVLFFAPRLRRARNRRSRGVTGLAQEDQRQPDHGQQPAAKAEQ